MNVLVYSSQTTGRIEYIFFTLLTAIGFQDVEFTNDQRFFVSSSLPRINYSDQPISDNEVWIKPVNLLFEGEIKPQPDNFFDWPDPSVHSSKDGGTSFSFDVFAASFYLITRYEEYLPHQKDMYGRFAHVNSLAFQHGFLNLPLVNLWLEELKRIITNLFPFVQLTPPVFRFIPTYDIDIAYSYLHKGFMRNAGGFLSQVLKGKWVEAIERIQVLLRKKNDPFDCYDWLNELHKQHGLQPIYFFLLAQKNVSYDKNILPENPAMMQLIKAHSAKYELSIHPSWQSGDDEEILKNEINLLRKMTGSNTDKSRQHYIRMTLPKTYQKLIQQGITDEYSMGYGSINGFRASYCLPYKWYDLSQEKTTSLTIHPFCYMDANSFYEQHLTAAQAVDEMKHYFKIVKQVNGELITIWHNHFLGSDNMFAGWKEVYEQFYFTMSG